MLAGIDPLYWKLAGGSLFIAILFFSITTDGLVKGKFGLPAWVFSAFSLVVGVLFFNIFLNSVNEFSVGRHVTLDKMLDAWEIMVRFVTAA